MRSGSGTLARCTPSALAVGLFLAAGTGCAPALVWEGKAPCRRQQIRVVEDHDKQRVLSDARVGHWYRGIGVEELTTSPDGAHLAYPARLDESWTVVLDGQELGRWDGIGELRFSADGRLAFSAERGRRWYVVSDGKAGTALDAIFARTLQWSADGQALIYAGSRSGYTHVVRNGKAGPAFHEIARLRLGKNGTRLLYAGRREDGWHVVDGDNVGPAYGAIVDTAIASNEQHVAYVWRTGSELGVVVDGAALPAFRDGLVSSLAIDNDGGMTFVASRAAGSCVVRRGVAQPLVARISKLVTTDAGHYAYVAQQANQIRVVIDGRDAGSADAAEELLPSPDGTRFLRALRHGQRWVVAGGDHEAAFDNVVAASLAWSRDGRHWGIIAGDARSHRIFISIDGRQERPLAMRDVVLLAERRPQDAPDEAEGALRALVAGEVDAATHTLCTRPE